MALRRQICSVLTIKFPWKHSSGFKESSFVLNNFSHDGTGAHLESWTKHRNARNSFGKKGSEDCRQLVEAVVLLPDHSVHNG